MSNHPFRALFECWVQLTLHRNPTTRNSTGDCCLIIIMLCCSTVKVNKMAGAVRRSRTDFIFSFVTSLTPALKPSCNHVFIPNVSVYRTTSVRWVQPPYHRCHCWRRHQRHQRLTPSTNLRRSFNVKMNRFRTHKNDRLPVYMPIKWRQISTTTITNFTFPYNPDDISFVLDSKCRESGLDSADASRFTKHQCTVKY